MKKYIAFALGLLLLNTSLAQAHSTRGDMLVEVTHNEYTDEKYTTKMKWNAVQLSAEELHFIRNMGRVSEYDLGMKLYLSAIGLTNNGSLITLEFSNPLYETQVTLTVPCDHRACIYIKGKEKSCVFGGESRGPIVEYYAERVRKDGLI